mmetsp:Transcript_11013/g.28448  ORF Transcript_11013/g.28448 Transcript_11013/m.28448 type:complete len:212 (+) Transcript_11013:2517-3152(+)
MASSRCKSPTRPTSSRSNARTGRTSSWGRCWSPRGRRGRSSRTGCAGRGTSATPIGATAATRKRWRRCMATPWAACFSVAPSGMTSSSRCSRSSRRGRASSAPTPIWMRRRRAPSRTPGTASAPSRSLSGPSRVALALSWPTSWRWTASSTRISTRSSRGTWTRSQRICASCVSTRASGCRTARSPTGSKSARPSRSSAAKTRGCCTIACS